MQQCAQALSKARLLDALLGQARLDNLAEAEDHEEQPASSTNVDPA